MKLTECSRGEQVRILDVMAGNGAKQNLSRMGLSIGNVIKIIRNSVFRGPVLVFYRETEIAIGHKLANKISVSRD